MSYAKPLFSNAILFFFYTPKPREIPGISQQLYITALENSEPVTATSSSVRTMAIEAFRLLHSEAAALHRIQERLDLAESLIFSAGASARAVQLGQSALGRAVRDLIDVCGETANHHILTLWPRLRLSLLSLGRLISKRDMASLGRPPNARAETEAERRMAGVFTAITGTMGHRDRTSGRQEAGGRGLGETDVAFGGSAVFGIVHSLTLGGDQRTLEDVRSCLAVMLARVVDSLGGSISDLERFHAARVQDRCGQQQFFAAGSLLLALLRSDGGTHQRAHKSNVLPLFRSLVS